jgi:hypothetical protein
MVCWRLFPYSQSLITCFVFKHFEYTYKNGALKCEYFIYICDAIASFFNHPFTLLRQPYQRYSVNLKFDSWCIPILYSSCHRHCHWIVPLVILVSSTRMYNLHSVISTHLSIHPCQNKNLHDFPNKKISTVIYNLRSGYAKLNDYWHKLNITESANCQCGERETKF